MAQSLNDDIKDRKIRLIASCDNLPAQGYRNIKKLKIQPNEQQDLRQAQYEANLALKAANEISVSVKTHFHYEKEKQSKRKIDKPVNIMGCFEHVSSLLNKAEEDERERMNYERENAPKKGAAAILQRIAIN